jgi:alcohol dehydrogenase
MQSAACKGQSYFPVFSGYMFMAHSMYLTRPAMIGQSMFMSDIYSFQTVPHLLFGNGASGQITDLIARFAAKRPVLITDKGVVACGLVDQIVQPLRQNGLDILVCDQVVADPPEGIVLDIAKQAIAHNADLVIGLGGGSPMDSAKVISVLAGPDPQPLAQIYGVGNVTAPRLPLVQIPTTSGTGSEVTCIAILTTGATTKAGIVDPALYADAAVLDPELTRGLPASITAATGIDAMVHAIEAYTGRLRKNPISDTLAIAALKLLTGNILRACKDGQNDIAAREAMLRGSMLAGQAFANSPVGAIHALAYPLGGIFHVPHGLSNALVMPHVMRFNLPAAAPLYAELADALNVKGQGDGMQRAEQFIDYLVTLSQQSGAPQRLRDIDIPYDALDRLADDAMLQTRLLVNNPCEATRDDARMLYEQAY